MFSEGNISCVETLLKPAKMVVAQGKPLAQVPFPNRVDLWNQVRWNYHRYLDEECGRFLRDLDNHFKSQFDAALLILAESFRENEEVFPDSEIFNDRERLAYSVIEEYNVFDILSIHDIKKRLVSQDEQMLRFLEEYSVAMQAWVNETLHDSAVRPSLRIFFKRRWDGYHAKVSTALSEAIIEYDWVGALLNRWKNSPPRTIIQIRDSVLTRCDISASMGHSSATDTHIEDSVLTRTTVGIERTTTIPKGDPVCPACGEACSPDMNFCSQCGTRIARKCPQCGNGLVEGGKFCTQCGSRIA